MKKYKNGKVIMHKEMALLKQLLDSTEYTFMVLIFHHDD